jgi:hypothetical protein
MSYLAAKRTLGYGVAELLAKFIDLTDASVFGKKIKNFRGNVEYSVRKCQADLSL